MKYLDYRLLVLSIMVVVAVSVGVTMFAFQPSPSPAAITVNRTAISQERFNRLLESRSSRLTRDEWLHSVIVKELLIQEAVKAGIQTEESFRQSVRDYYEQSLIKTIMDRTYTSLDPRVDEALVDRYMDLSDKTVSLTLMTFKQPEDLARGQVETQDSLTVPFRGLSTQVKYDLLHLHPGENTEPAFSETDKVYSVIRLDNIIASSEETERKENRGQVLTLLREQEKERLISSWLDDLKKKATVTVSADARTFQPSNSEF